MEGNEETSSCRGGTESSCDNINLINLQTSTLTTSDGDREKSLEYADELMERGSKASKDHDYSEATDCYSRSLEIRAAHYGELAPECVNSYYKYGCVLLYKAQEEADPLGAVPKKEGESSSASVSGNGELEGSSKPQEGAADDKRQILTHLKDYYKVLEVDYDATDEKIKLNYRKLALKWHPDKHKGDNAVTAKFQQINEAYTVLSDPAKRLDYDITGNYEIDKYTLREYLTRFKGMILTCNGLGHSN
ncbi:unnamed protein product [Camellia sinensis]